MKSEDFRTIDLLVLSVLAFITEFLGYLLVTKLNSPFYISFSFAVCVIAMIRWGAVGVITYLIAGIALVFLKGADDIIIHIIYEVIANGAICIPFLFLLKKNGDWIVEKTRRFLFVTIGCVGSVCLAKGIVLMFVNESQTGIIDYFGSSMLILVVNLLLLFMLYKIKTKLLVDMKNYLSNDQKQED